MQLKLKDFPRLLVFKTAIASSLDCGLKVSVSRAELILLNIIMLCEAKLLLFCSDDLKLVSNCFVKFYCTTHSKFRNK